MNSIRPLITITILIVVGAFLYVKINEGPARLAPAAGDAESHQAPDGVPPVAATAAAARPDGSPPAWASQPPLATTPDTAPSGFAEPNQYFPSAQQPPAVPPIPDMPKVAVQQPAVDPSAVAGSIPDALPANIPTASYPDQPSPPAAHLAADTSAAAAASNASQPTTPEQANDFDAATTNLQSPPLASQQNPLKESSPSAAGERYPSELDPAASAAVDPPTNAAIPSFATSWPTIQKALDQGELSQAHQLLSQWYHDPTLTPTDAELVDKLLSQLAGTVVYSTEHRLEPAHIVKPGETLEAIAQLYNVPWQLLSKINGVPAAGPLQPGQELKVVRGPFSAVVDLDRKQLTLMLADRYAGKFPITVPSAAAVTEGQWTVDNKVVVPSTSVVQSAYTPTPVAVDRAIILRDESAGPATPGAALTIGSGETPAEATASPPQIRVTARDAEEIADILSIGSRVVIRR